MGHKTTHGPQESGTQDLTWTTREWGHVTSHGPQESGTQDHTWTTREWDTRPHMDHKRVGTCDLTWTTREWDTRPHMDHKRVGRGYSNRLCCNLVSLYPGYGALLRALFTNRLKLYTLKHSLLGSTHTPAATGLPRTG